MGMFSWLIKPSVEVSRKRRAYKKRVVSSKADGPIVIDGPRLPTAEPVKTKACRKCDKILAIGEFNRQTKAEDGHQPYCRKCQRRYQHSLLAKVRKKAAREQRIQADGPILHLYLTKNVAAFSAVAEKRGVSRCELVNQAVADFLVLNEEN